MKTLVFFVLFCSSLTLWSQEKMIFEHGNRVQAGQAPATAQAASKERLLDPAIRKVIDSFFESLSKGEVDSAYSYLTKGTKIHEKNDELNQLKNKTRQAIDLFGQIRGSELVDIRLAGEHLARATYISLGKNFPLRWRFYFYRGEQEWMLVDIRVDDRLADIFSETPEKD